MDINREHNPGSGQMRIVQELVAGKEITLAHIIGGGVGGIAGFALNSKKTVG